MIKRLAHILSKEVKTMYFKETELTTPKTILAIPDHYVAIPIMVGDTDVTADDDGRKIVPAGTILGGGVIADRSQAAKKSVDGQSEPLVTAVAAEGVLMNDVDVTGGPEIGALIIHGFIDVTKLPEAPTATMITALKQITFIGTKDDD